MIEWNKHKSKVTPLKKGQKATYELINIGVDQLSTDQRPAIPFMMGVPTKDRIIDEGDEVADIAYIKGYTHGDQPQFGEITFTKAMAGTITLSGDRPEERKMYEYMELCNYNASNPKRDQGINPIFKRQDYKKDKAEERSRRNLLVEALNASKKLTAVETKRLAVALNITAEDQDEVAIRIEEFAENNPAKFLAMLENADLSIMEVADAAQKAGLILVDAQARKIMSSNKSTLYTWAPEAGVDWKEKFVQFTKSEEGQAFYKEIQSSLKAKK
jgi:hypothetical protein